MTSIREVLGSSVSDEVTFQAASEPESAAIMVEAASSGTREAKRGFTGQGRGAQRERGFPGEDS